MAGRRTAVSDERSSRFPPSHFHDPAALFSWVDEWVDGAGPNESTEAEPGRGSTSRDAVDSADWQDDRESAPELGL